MPNYYRLQVEFHKKSSDSSFSGTVQKADQTSTHNSKKQKSYNVSKMFKKAEICAHKSRDRGRETVLPFKRPTLSESAPLVEIQQSPSPKIQNVRVFKYFFTKNAHHDFLKNFATPSLDTN